MKQLIALALFFLALLFLPLHAMGQIQNIATDKSQYYEGESINFSGKVIYDENTPFLILRVLNPSESDFVFITQLIIKPDGTFNGSFIADGPKWSSEGPYKILVNYGNFSQEKIINFKLSTESTETNNKTKEPIHKETTQTSDNEKKSIPIEPSTQNLKTKLTGFPSLDKSPQYYLNRYYSEDDYRKWFDSQFPKNTIEEVVGYPKTAIPNFPDESKSPQYYIQRYTKELDYRNWFHSQFPNDTIYSILGFKEPVHVPGWIKMNAGWWSTGKISDNDFVQGLQYMIDNNIIILNAIPSGKSSESEIPSWVRNVANWWSNDLISEDEFVQSLRYLIDQGIVVVN